MLQKLQTGDCLAACCKTQESPDICRLAMRQWRIRVSLNPQDRERVAAARLLSARPCLALHMPNKRSDQYPDNGRVRDSLCGMHVRATAPTNRQSMGHLLTRAKR